MGKLADTDISIGHAVSASTAFPLFLPALDEVFPFDNCDGMRRERRVSLTDGGVYDNLGLAPLWPDRDPQISLNVARVDVIICCRAGYGLRLDPPTLSFYKRMKGAFDCLFGRAQNSATKRLFELRDAKKLSGFVMPYLGQNDSRLRYPPDDLVTRKKVFTYPTNFCAMSEEWIDKLSLRGEQLTKALIAEHLPHLKKRY